MSVTSPFSVAYTAASPKKAFAKAITDRPLIWRPVDQQVYKNTFTVSAERSFANDDMSRALTYGTHRDWTACFFTLSGKQGCITPSKMTLSKDNSLPLTT